MISSKTITTVPPDLVECMSEVARLEGGHKIDSIRSYIALSKETRYITEDGTPLFVIGAFRPTYFSAYAELWMFTSTHLKARHMRTLKDMIWDWMEAQQPLRIVARAKTPNASRMLEFLGFDLKEDCLGIKQYEAPL